MTPYARTHYRAALNDMHRAIAVMIGATVAGSRTSAPTGFYVKRARERLTEARRLCGARP